MADSYPPFTSRPFTRTNSIHRNNDSNNYMRLLGKLLFFTFFLIAIPLFPSQAPDFINQTVLNKFWELLHLMFIGIAVSYGVFGRRNIGNGNLDDSDSYVSGMFHASSIFEDGFDHSMYYSGQGKAGFFNVKNGSFDNPYEENVVQAWSSKYVQGEPMVVLAQPHCGLETYGELGSFIDHKPLGLPVRRLKSRVGSRVSPEFGNGSSESSCPIVKDSSDSSDKSRSGRFGDLGSENLGGKFNESDVLGSPIPWRRSRSVRMRERVGGGATRPSHFRPLSVDETQFESLKSRSLQSTVSFSSQLSSQSHSPSSLSPSHSNSSESPKSKMSELAKELRSPRQSFPPTSPLIPKPMSSKASVNASHSRQYSDGSLMGIHGRKCFEDELKEFCDSKKDDSASSKEWISGFLKFDAKPVAPSKASSRGKSVRTFRTFRGSGNTIGSRDAGEKQENHRKGKLAMGFDEIEEVYTGESEPKIGHNNLSIGFNRQNHGGSGNTIGSRDAGEKQENHRKGKLAMGFDEIEEVYTGESEPKIGHNNLSIGFNRQNHGGSGNTIGSRDAGEKQENHRKGNLAMGSDEIEEVYTGESEPKIGHNNLSVGFNRQNLGGDSYIPKPTSPRNQNREKQECLQNSESERENEDFQVSSDEETMSGAFSVAGSDTYEVDRKAGEFIAKFREQIRLQRTTSIDTPRGLNITGNFFK